MPRPLRAIGKHAWMVHDDGERIAFSAGTYSSWFSIADDAFENNVKHQGTPRTGAIAVIGKLASDQLDLRWKLDGTKAVATLKSGDAVAEVRPSGPSYTVRVLVDAPSAQLHFAAAHGITVLRAAGYMKARKRSGK